VKKKTKDEKNSTTNNDNSTNKGNESPSNPAVQIQANLSSNGINGDDTHPTPENNVQPNVVEDQKALDDRSVFVSNIDKTTDADQLKAHFESCGAIERITILANKFTGEPKGSAYIQFKSKVAVANALMLDGKTWQNKEIEVKPKRTNLPAWMLGRGRARGRGEFRGRGTFRGRGRGFSYRGYRGGYRGRGYWHPYVAY